MGLLAAAVECAPVDVSDAVIMALRVDMRWRRDDVRQLDRLARLNRCWQIGSGASLKIEPRLERRSQVGNGRGASVLKLDDYLLFFSRIQSHFTFWQVQFTH